MTPGRRPVDSAQRERVPSTPEAEALVISLLGGFQARVGASTIHLPTRKTQALLAYLALHPGQPHDRERLRGCSGRTPRRARRRPACARRCSRCARPCPGRAPRPC